MHIRHVVFITMETGEKMYCTRTRMYYLTNSNHWSSIFYDCAVQVYQRVGFTVSHLAQQIIVTYRFRWVGTTCILFLVIQARVLGPFHLTVSDSEALSS